MSGVSFSTKALQSAMGIYGITEKSLKNNFPKIGEWISGEKRPTLKQLNLLAKAVYVPLGFLFLPDLPAIYLPIPLYRTNDKTTSDSFSPELYESVMTIASRQTWVREFLIENFYHELGFVGSASIFDDPKDIADKIRKELGLDVNWANTFSTWENALDKLRERIDDIGIFVVSNSVFENNTHRPLKVEEFRGFVMIDNIAPILFINGADSKAAQMFTLAHELAHIWIGKSAVFDIDSLLPADNDIEKFCDKVAAEFLVPSCYLTEDWRKYQGSEYVITTLASKYKVSEIVVARRLLDCKCIAKKQFFEFYNEYLDRLSKPKRHVGKGGDFYNTQNMRVGKRFMRLVSYAVGEGSLPYTEAFRLTGLYGKTFYNYEEKVVK